MHILKPLARSGVGCKLAAASDLADGAQMFRGGCRAELATGKAIAGGGVALKGHIMGQHGGADAASADQLAMLQAEAAVTGEAVADLAAAIVAMADAYASIAAQLAGLRRKTRAVIEAATTPAQVRVALAALDAALLTLGAG